MFSIVLNHPVKTKFILGAVGVERGLLSLESAPTGQHVAVSLSKDNAVKLVKALIKEYDLGGKK